LFEYDMQQLPSYTSKSLIFLALPRVQECQSRVEESDGHRRVQDRPVRWLLAVAVKPSVACVGGETAWTAWRSLPAVG